MKHDHHLLGPLDSQSVLQINIAYLCRMSGSFQPNNNPALELV